MTKPIRIALVGIGKIARDQHIPALAADDGFDLAAAASRAGRVDGIPNFGDVDALLASHVQVDAVSLCTPPQGRFAQARAVISAGRHLMLEKPPGQSVAEVTQLAEMARRAGVSLFAAWHSREASAVAQARNLLTQRAIKSVSIVWKEDIRRWHPGQDWILEAGGMGVFDPGINALSVLTAILPHPVRLRSASLDFPANRGAPIAATLDMVTDQDTPVRAELDFLQTGPQNWDIAIDTDGGQIILTDGGARLNVDGEAWAAEPNTEYPRLYARFAELIAAGESEVDLAPFQLVADAFMLGQRSAVAPFDW